MPKKRPRSQGKFARVLAALALLAGLMLVALGLYRPHEGTRPVAASSAIRVPMPAAPRPPEPVVAPVPPAEPALPAPRPAWQRNAVEAGPEDGRPMIAIVIDDMGPDRARSAAVLALPGPLTLSFLAYADALPDQTRAARAHGHEVMLHVPMEPLNPRVDPGPNALTVALDDAELRRRLGWDLDRIDGLVGINNHMGSRFTEWRHGMSVVEEMLRQRGLFMLDSRTTPRTVVVDIARSIGLPHAQRDVFLDDDRAAQAVGRALERTEAVAHRQGYAVAIGHPHDATVTALRAWLPGLRDKGFRQVPVSAIVAHDEAASLQETAD